MRRSLSTNQQDAGRERRDEPRIEPTPCGFAAPKFHCMHWLGPRRPTPKCFETKRVHSRQYSSHPESESSLPHSRRSSLSLCGCGCGSFDSDSAAARRPRVTHAGTPITSIRYSTLKKDSTFCQ